MAEAVRLMTATLGMADVTVIDAFWLGRATEDGTRKKCPLLVRFRSAREKREVQRKCREVRPKGVFVDDDLSAEERAVRVKMRMAKKLAEKTSPSDGPSTPTSDAAPQHHEPPLALPPAPSSPQPSTSSAPGAAPEAAVSAQPTPAPAKDKVGPQSRSPPLPAAKRARLVTNPARARQQPVPKAPRGRRKPAATDLREYFSRTEAATPDKIRCDRAGSAPAPVLSPIDQPRSSPPSAPPPTSRTPPPPDRSSVATTDGDGTVPERSALWHETDKLIGWIMKQPESLRDEIVCGVKMEVIDRTENYVPGMFIKFCDW